MSCTFTIEIGLYNDGEPRYSVYENWGDVIRDGILTDDAENRWMKDFHLLKDALEEISKRICGIEALYLEPVNEEDENEQN